MGGGTPSQAKLETIQEILSWLPLEECEEVTFEVNPDDLTLAYAKGLKASGVDRLSLGVQTLSDPLLKAIGRTHSGEKALDAVEIAASAGIENLSIDLMLDLPNQTLTDLDATLTPLKGLPITHVSLYNLVLEPPSLFYRKRKEIKLPSDTTSLAMLGRTCEALESYGLKRYEISAFAKPGYEARHNSRYWLGLPFLGLGPSAFSYWNGIRFRNIANLEAYSTCLEEGRSPVDFEENLDKEKKWRELFVIALRLVKGVEIKTFTENHGPIPKEFDYTELMDQKLLQEEKGSIALTDRGRLFYDTVASELVV